jgi:hypothetical protein
LLEDARSDDADDAEVPASIGLDNNEMFVGLEFGLQQGNDLGSRAAFESLALAIVGIEGLSKWQGGSEVTGEEKVQGLFGIFEPASSVEARGELEAYFINTNRIWGLGDALERDEAGALGHVQALKTSGDKDAIFAGERNEVGDGAEGDQVQERTKVVIGGGRDGEFAGALEKGVREFESEADRAQFMEWWSGGVGWKVD